MRVSLIVGLDIHQFTVFQITDGSLVNDPTVADYGKTNICQASYIS